MVLLGTEATEETAMAASPAPTDLCRWQADNRWTDTALARALHVHPRTISRWKNGETRSPGWLPTALRGLDVPKRTAPGAQAMSDHRYLAAESRRPGRATYVALASRERRRRRRAIQGSAGVAWLVAAAISVGFTLLGAATLAMIVIAHQYV